jgi:hypothetical protein
MNRSFRRETPVAESKVTEKVVEDVEDTPVVASGEEPEKKAAAPVEDAPASTTTTTEEEVPAVEKKTEEVAVAAEVTENGNGDATAAEVVEPVVEEAGKSKQHATAYIGKHLTQLFFTSVSEESVKRKAADIEVPEVPEKKAKTDDVEAAVVEPVEEVTA